MIEGCGDILIGCPGGGRENVGGAVSALVEKMG